MKRKASKKPRHPKINLDALLPRPKPVAIHGPLYYLKHAQEYPILGCWVFAGWKEEGITPVVVARQQDADKVIFGVFLVDWYCLGVKDAFCNADFSLKEFRRKLPHLCSGDPKPCDADFAHELIYGALEFAGQYGLKPHKDYKIASQVLDPPDAYLRKHNIRFGKDGKPFYVSGPYDSPHRIRQIVDTLMRTAGEGNFDYIVMAGGSEDSTFEEDL